MGRADEEHLAVHREGGEPLLGLKWGSCPSVLLSPKAIKPDYAVAVYSRFLATMGNASQFQCGSPTMC